MSSTAAANASISTLNDELLQNRPDRFQG
jgi:hypothetical protein